MKKRVLNRLDALIKDIALKVTASNKPVIYKDGILASTWEVKKLEKNNYCIVCKKTDTMLVKNIELYEVAFNIAKLVNKGYAISSQNVNEILIHHKQFSEKFYEAIFCKQRRNQYASEADWIKFDVMDAKYRQAKGLAYIAKKKLQESYQNR
jgi:hypothetical protein|tara:strand:+ start:1057 stop:1512 length:456 start_codon:yes stop_codon:yes gene_type:complete